MTFSRSDYENFLQQATEELSELEAWLAWQTANCPFALPEEIRRYAECTVASLTEDIARYRSYLP